MEAVFTGMLISAGGVWIALAALLVVIGLLYSTHNESFFLGLGVIFLAILAGEYLLGLGIFAAIAANPFVLLFGLGGYAVIGTLYAAWWKMPNFLDSKKDSISKRYDIWKSRLDKDQDPSYEEFLNSQSYPYSVRDNKDRVASWVLLWPLNILWELSHKPFVWVWEKAYYGIGRVLENVNSKHATKILEESRNKKNP